MVKRYYVSSFLRGEGFNEIGPYVKQQMGRTANNWVKGDIKVQRKTIYGRTTLIISRKGIHTKTFDISNGENREANIKAFENFIRSIPFNSQTKEAIIVDTSELIEQLKDFESKVRDIRNTIEQGKTLDPTQHYFVLQHKII